MLHTTSFGFAFRVGYSKQPSRALALEDFTSHSDKQRLRLISEQQDGNFEGHIRYVVAIAIMMQMSAVHLSSLERVASKVL